MILGFGWCHLQASRKSISTAAREGVDDIDAQSDAADNSMFASFRKWMAAQDDTFLQWTFSEDIGNHRGLLNYCVSRNHRPCSVWAMLEWIRVNAERSYGLFYCYDDEDSVVGRSPDRAIGVNYDNVFRVHRLKAGVLDEIPDPFFGKSNGDQMLNRPFKD